MNIIIALLILSFLVLFHELGHFIVARFFGVRVEVLSIGFGRKIAYFTHKGTQYAISLIPLGGYVKLKGQDDTNPSTYGVSTNELDSYLGISPLKRICILLAGPLFNILLAFFIYVGIGLNGKDVLLPIIGEVIDGGSAKLAGLVANDNILAINDKRILSWEELDRAIMETNGNDMLVLIERKDKELEFHIKPQMKQSQNIFGETILRPMLGIKSGNMIGKVSYSGLNALRYGFDETLRSSTLIIQGFAKIISGVIPTSQVSGVVGIVSVIGMAKEYGVISLLLLSALISVNLGILNLLPIPALDGGHIMFNGYELLTRKIPNEKVAYYLTIGGWAILLGLMTLGLYNDIFRLLG